MDTKASELGGKTEGRLTIFWKQRQPQHTVDKMVRWFSKLYLF